MGYFLTTSSDRPPARSHVGPKTHTPGLQVQERGLRFYSPGIGRWTARDPIEEEPRRSFYLRNLTASKYMAAFRQHAAPDLYYAFGNDPVSALDFLGLLS